MSFAQESFTCNELHTSQSPLQVPLSLLVRESGSAKRASDKFCDSTTTESVVTAKPELLKLPSQALPCIKHFMFWSVCLLLLSDIQLRQHMDHYKTSFVQYIFPEPGRTYSRPVGAPPAVHWTSHVYGYMLKVKLVQHYSQPTVSHAMHAASHCSKPMLCFIAVSTIQRTLKHISPCTVFVYIYSTAMARCNNPVPESMGRSSLTHAPATTSQSARKTKKCQ